MRYTVCHNPACSRNIECIGDYEPSHVTLNIPHSNGYSSYPDHVIRHLYRTLVSDGHGESRSVDTYLCDVCHEAVQLVRNPGIFNAERAKT